MIIRCVENVITYYKDNKLELNKVNTIIQGISEDGLATTIRNVIKPNGYEALYNKYMGAIWIALGYYPIKTLGCSIYEYLKEDKIDAKAEEISSYLIESNYDYSKSIVINGIEIFEGSMILHKDYMLCYVHQINEDSIVIEKHTNVFDPNTSLIVPIGVLEKSIVTISDLLDTNNKELSNVEFKRYDRLIEGIYYESREIKLWHRLQECLTETSERTDKLVAALSKEDTAYILISSIKKQYGENGLSVRFINAFKSGDLHLIKARYFNFMNFYFATLRLDFMGDKLILDNGINSFVYSKDEFLLLVNRVEQDAFSIKLDDVQADKSSITFRVITEDIKIKKTLINAGQITLGF